MHLSGANHGRPAAGRATGDAARHASAGGARRSIAASDRPARWPPSSPHAAERLVPAVDRRAHDAVAPLVRVDRRVDDPRAVAAGEAVRVDEDAQPLERPAAQRSGTSRSSRSGAHSRAAHATSHTAEPGLARSKSISADGDAAGEDDVVEVRVVVADEAVAELRRHEARATRGRRRRTTPPRRGSGAAARRR